MAAAQPGVGAHESRWTRNLNRGLMGSAPGRIEGQPFAQDSESLSSDGAVSANGDRHDSSDGDDDSLDSYDSDDDPDNPHNLKRYQAALDATYELIKGIPPYYRGLSPDPGYGDCMDGPDDQSRTRHYSSRGDPQGERLWAEASTTSRPPGKGIMQPSHLRRALSAPVRGPDISLGGKAVPLPASVDQPSEGSSGLEQPYPGYQNLHARAVNGPSEDGLGTEPFPDYQDPFEEAQKSPGDQPSESSSGIEPFPEYQDPLAQSVNVSSDESSGIVPFPDYQDPFEEAQKSPGDQPSESSSGIEPFPEYQDPLAQSVNVSSDESSGIVPFPEYQDPLEHAQKVPVDQPSESSSDTEPFPEYEDLLDLADRLKHASGSSSSPSSDVGLLSSLKTTNRVQSERHQAEFQGSSRKRTQLSGLRVPTSIKAGSARRFDSSAYEPLVESTSSRPNVNIDGPSSSTTYSSSGRGADVPSHKTAAAQERQGSEDLSPFVRILPASDESAPEDGFAKKNPSRRSRVKGFIRKVFHRDAQSRQEQHSAKRSRIKGLWWRFRHGPVKVLSPTTSSESVIPKTKTAAATTQSTPARTPVQPSRQSAPEPKGLTPPAAATMNTRLPTKVMNKPDVTGTRKTDVKGKGKISEAARKEVSKHEHRTARDLAYDILSPKADEMAKRAAETTRLTGAANTVIMAANATGSGGAAGGGGGGGGGGGM